MADEKGGGGDSGLGFFLIFFGAIFAFWLISGGGQGGGIFGNATSSFFGVYSSTTIESYTPEESNQGSFVR
jgi:hypothetical protein